MRDIMNYVKSTEISKSSNSHYQKNKITIITTIYNLNPYTNNFIQSINTLNNLMDFNLIIVDDGSTDDIYNLVYNKINSEKKLYIKNELNKGILFSLNEAFKSCETDYCMVLDSDDEVHETNLSLLNGLINSTSDFDIVFFKSSENKNRILQNWVIPQINLYPESRELVLKKFISNTHLGALSNKIIKTSLIKQIDFHFDFEMIRFNPDNVVSFITYLRATKLGHFDNIIYLATLRFNSTNRQFNKNRHKEYKLYHQFVEKCLSSDNELLKLNDLRLFKQLVYDLTSFNYKNINQFKKYSSEIIFLIESIELYSTISKDKNLPFKYKAFNYFRYNLVLLYFYGFMLKATYILTFYIKTIWFKIKFRSLHN